ncbi:hypothetical protein XENORESO_017615 [Xenotaenia resolanae]|uniref:Uncharacterized protein n=1 Tax=Xenotaenia resolanae TaxID=208358 RepID=A0ABV0WUF5_9TELE
MERKYNKEWEKENAVKEWIRPQLGDDSKALCLFCKCEIHAHHSDLIQHANTDKHKKTAPFSFLKLTNMGFTAPKQNESKQRNELKIATYVACHSLISAVDHLGESTGSTDSEIKLHRTKCTALINHAVGLCIFKDLMSDIGDA